MEEVQDNNPTRKSLYGRLKDVAIVASGEAIAGKPSQWVLLGLMATGLAFEWGPGNEWLIGAVGASAHESFDPTNFAELAATSTVAGLAAGTASAVEQTALGVLMAGTVRSFPKAFKKWDETREHKPFHNPENNNGDIMTGIALGTSAVVIEKNAQNPDRTFNQDAKMATKTAVAIGGINAALVTGVSVGVRLLDNVGYDTAAETLETIAKNPLTYIAVFGLVKANQYRKARKIEKPNLVEE